MSITVKTFCASSNKGKEMKDKANTLKQVWLQSSHGKHVEKRIFRERGTSDAAPRSRHQKKALCFQTEYPRGSTLPGGRSAGSQLGFWTRPLQRGLRHLQVWRVITSVSSPYIPMLTYISLLLLIQLKTDPASYDFRTLFFRLPSQELLRVVCRPCVFSIHREKLWDFSLNGHETLKCGAPYNRQNKPRQKWLSDLNKAFSVRLFLIVVWHFRHLYFSLQYVSWACYLSSGVELLVH